MNASDLVRRLPPPCRHDDEGFAHSFELRRTNEIREFFQTYGYVVIRNVLTPDEVEASTTELFGQFDHNDESSVSKFLNRSDNRLAGMGILGIRSDVHSLAQPQNREFIKHSKSSTITSLN